MRRKASEQSYHGKVVLVEDLSPSFKFQEERLDGASNNLQLLEVDVMELVKSALEALNFYAFVEECPQTEIGGVEVKVAELDGPEDRGTVVLLGRLSPSLEITFELMESRTRPS